MSVAKPVRLEPGPPKRQLAEGETHPYLLRLEAGEYIRIVAEQRGVDLLLRLVSPGGELIAKVDSPTGTRGFERVSEIAAAAGEYRVEVVGGEGTPTGDYEIRVAERRAAMPADRKRVEGERVFLEGEGLRREEKIKEAVARYERALGLWREAGDLGGQASALYSMGRMREQLHRRQEAIELCTEAADLYRRAGDPTGQAQALNRAGRLLIPSEEARPPLEEAVRLFRDTSDEEGEASALMNLGNLHSLGSRLQEAIDAYDETIVRRLGGSRDRASALLGKSDVYLKLGHWSEARSGLESALQIAEDLKDREVSAFALYVLGVVESREARFAEARARGEQALALYRQLGDRPGQALALNALGSVLLAQGDRDKAQGLYEEALALFRDLEDAKGVAMVTLHLGRVALARGDARQAFELQKDALAGFEQLGHRLGISSAHYGIAQVLRQLGDPDGALREVEASLALAEHQRTETSSLDLRAFYFATRQHYWELKIDLLRELDRLRPQKRFAEQAFEAEEGRRARSLLDALAESDVPEGKTLSLEEIQKRLLDTNTLLLVYSLGEERSVLWKITRSTLASYELPPRRRIETAAELAHDVLSRRLRSGSVLRQQAVDDLAAIVLEPVAQDLPKFRRLIIVADGALQRVPFGALPDPGSSPVEGRRSLLVEGHPIIYLPSASVGATLREERRTGPLHRRPGPMIAVLADPVFDESDSRVRRSDQAPPTEETKHGSLARSLRDLGMEHLERLPYTREEAEAIQKVGHRSGVVSVLDFAANREILEDERWRQAPILHFATHGLINDRQPELSGLALSQVTQEGTRRTDGFLRLREISRLKLDADLVVLSACQTGAGKELRGEGLFGLTRSFLSIGVPQLVVSLWKVEDRATKELMKRFYEELFNGYLPAEALQRAQKSMLGDAAWSDPSLWAGFIFVGDFERRPGGGIEARDTGGSNLPPQDPDNAGMPTDKVKPKPKPPKK